MKGRGQRRREERRLIMKSLRENIEMELFVSVGLIAVVQQECVVEDPAVEQSQREHPLEDVELSEESEESEESSDPVQQQQEIPSVPMVATPAKTTKEALPVTAPAIIPLESMESVEIEMDVFPPSGSLAEDMVKITSGDPSVMCTTPEPFTPALPPIRHSKLKWRSLPAEKRGLVVKDVVCLPRGHYLAQDVRHSVPREQERADLSAMGLIARITMDYSWLAHEMESRLASLFRGRFFRGRTQRFTFTYLQCLQGSRVLFVPDPPPRRSWTGEEVLRIAGQGNLYILSHHDYQSTEAECDWSTCRTSMIDRQEFCVDSDTDSRDEEASEDTRVGSPLCATTGDEIILGLDNLLRTYREENTLPEVQTRVHVTRRDILGSALKVLRKPLFCFKTPPLFHFLGEETEGYDGPMREFFRLLLLQLQQSPILEGHPGYLLLAYDQAALEERRYHSAGVMVAWALLHGGPGPRCLHPALYQLMCGLSPDLEDFPWRDIADVDVQIRLQQLRSCTDVQNLSPGLCEWIAGCGLPGIYTAPSKDLSSIYRRVVRHYIYHRVASMISQFTEGLNSCGGLWDLMKAHSAAFLPVMTDPQQPLSLDQFRGLLEVAWSPQESHLRPTEETTVDSWESVLIMVNENQTALSFGDLLAFITGAEHLPPLGFPRHLCMRFYSQDPGTPSVRLPHASTCALELFLPRDMASPAALRDMLARAVQESLGFGDLHTDCSSLSQ